MIEKLKTCNSTWLNKEIVCKHKTAQMKQMHLQKEQRQEQTLK